MHQVQIQKIMYSEAVILGNVQTKKKVGYFSQTDYTFFFSFCIYAGILDLILDLVVRYGIYLWHTFGIIIYSKHNNTFFSQKSETIYLLPAAFLGVR